MKIAIIGAGQQGTSQGLAYSRLPDVKTVVFYDTDPARQAVILLKAAQLGLPTEKLSFTQDIYEAVEGSDVLAINTPSSAFKELAQKIARSDFKDGVILYDNGSCKTSAIEVFEAELAIIGDLNRNKDNQRWLHYFGAHFFVGRAGSGPEFADPDMYKNQTAAITGPDGVEKEKLIDLFKSIGVTNVRTDLSPKQHDEALGFYSHHNTLAITSLMLTFPDVTINGKPIQIGRFLSTTRVAAHGVHGATFWGPVANDNAVAINKARDLFVGKLQEIAEDLRRADEHHLSRDFKLAHEYVTAIKQDRPYEGIEGDMYDILAQVNEPNIPRDPQSLAAICEEPFSEDFERFVVSHVAMPIVFAAASALAARDFEVYQRGQHFSSIGNSSFHDAIRPMRDDPQKAIDFFSFRKPEIAAAIDRLIRTHRDVTGGLSPLFGSAQNLNLLNQSHAIRSQLPPAPKSARPEFTVGG